EYTEVGNALRAGDDYRTAIKYYKDAVNAPPRSPITQVDALRYEGSAYYHLGQIAAGHALMMQSVAIYAGNKDMTKEEAAYSIGQSLADDAWYEMQTGNCKVGLAEFTAASKRLAQVGGGNETDQEWISSDSAAYKQYCVSGSANVSNG